MPGPLDGVKVLDLTSIYSGPICASILGDHGADVVKIEAPEGDTMRGGGRYARHGVPGPFAMMNPVSWSGWVSDGNSCKRSMKN